jgi:hypothetical protein
MGPIRAKPESPLCQLRPFIVERQDAAFTTTRPVRYLRGISWQTGLRGRGRAEHGSRPRRTRNLERQPRRDAANSSVPRAASYQGGQALDQSSHHARHLFPYIRHSCDCPSRDRHGSSAWPLRGIPLERHTQCRPAESSALRDRVAGAILRYRSPQIRTRSPPSRESGPSLRGSGSGAGRGRGRRRPR